MIPLYIVCMLCMMFDVAAHESSWQDAAQLYARGSYEQALDIYQDMEPKTPALYYNMATITYQLGDYVRAHLYWLRAQRYGNAQIFTLSTKRLLELQEQGVIAPLSKIHLWLWWFSKYLSIYFLQIVALLIWYVLLYVLYKKSKQWRLVVMLLSLLFCCMMPIIASYKAQKSFGIIIAATPLYNGPATTYYHLAEVERGSVVSIQKVHDGWLSIRHQNQLGWVPQESLEPI